MTDPTPKSPRPFRRAVFRGLGIVLPPLLTVVLLIKAWTIVDQFILVPVEKITRIVMVGTIKDIRDEPAPGAPSSSVDGPEGKSLRAFILDGVVYVRLPQGHFIPVHVYEAVNQNPGDVPLVSGNAYYHRYVRIHWLKRRVFVPVFFCIFILLLYLMGKFVAAGVGRLTWTAIESLIQRLPLIRNVYSSVKQITDFLFTESEIEFTRVVAVEYPRKGIWSIGFVTGESLLDISSAANEHVLSVLMPTSPIPGTGFTVTVLKSETIDLAMSVEEALQFVVSCGVVVPLQQQQKPIVSSMISAAITSSVATDSSDGTSPLDEAPKGGNNMSGNGDGSATKRDRAGEESGECPVSG
ncbi:MAG TPA: DUF502 domain-containing protein [Planctomycetaceae bacterium]|nr:DUF502 domain-containing protein [Planctomycetaceae bacterium]